MSKSITGINGKTPNAWGLPKTKENTKHHKEVPKNASAKSKYMELSKNYESSSDEEIETKAIDSIFKSYIGDKKELQKTQQFLENVFQSGAATCLICIATIKHSESIWSCEHCYSFFHLNCIQRWANDSTAQKKLHQDQEVGYYNNQGEYIAKVKKIIKWNCPNCRHDYGINEIPRVYTCFCKKEINPQNQPWLVPHSCGELCQKDLKPNCGHQCVLLCHPGDCPPCPQMISISCECGQSKLKTIRCSQKSWTCQSNCQQKLKCGIHVCGKMCHSPDKCLPCNKKSLQSCICGNETQERNCTDLIWKCKKICNRKYACGLHKCQVRCHATVDGCGDCPLGLPRECPCGKEKSQAPCTEDIGPCGDTCQKLLSCGLHICVERCHRGNCGQCLEIIKKECRCGAHSKELPCTKQYLCETKCKQMRDCNKHACNRKCCDNQCPPCDKICGKTLSCGKHKCTSLCHHGLCYPCNLKAVVKCRCGLTTINVPCGRERKTRPPKCYQPCKIPSKCHHTNPHRCHINDCPECTQKCWLPNATTKCPHPCKAICHDAVKVSIIDKNFKPAGPWDVPIEKIEIQKKPHPPCEIDVAVTCIGGHETVDWPCWNSKPTSCGRLCGRQLKCGNHTCQIQCHDVSDSASKEEDKNCQSCTEGCLFLRPTGCFHKCPKPCHSSACDQCNIRIKVPCHCSLTQVYYKCGDFYRGDDSLEHKLVQEKMQSCGNRCIKDYPCGHQCTNVCHSGNCPNEELCKKKVKIYCECRTRKTETTCDRVRNRFAISCNELCTQKIDLQREAIEEAERKQREYEEEKNRLELQEFEKKFGKKKYKERKQYIVEENESKFGKWAIGISLVVCSISIAVYILFLQ